MHIAKLWRWTMPTFNLPQCGECRNHRSPRSKLVHPQGDAQRNIGPDRYKVSSMVSVFDNTRLKKLRKLTIASKSPGSFCKLHKDTPRVENMFGSLVVVVPSRHEGEGLCQGEKLGLRLRSCSLDVARPFHCLHRIWQGRRKWSFKFPLGCRWSIALSWLTTFILTIPPHPSLLDSHIWGDFTSGPLGLLRDWIWFRRRERMSQGQGSDHVWRREWIPWPWDRGTWSCGGFVFESCRRWADMRRGWGRWIKGLEGERHGSYKISAASGHPTYVMETRILLSAVTGIFVLWCRFALWWKKEDCRKGSKAGILGGIIAGRGRFIDHA